jgi:hypothetical protein
MVDVVPTGAHSPLVVERVPDSRSWMQIPSYSETHVNTWALQHLDVVDLTGIGCGSAGGLSRRRNSERSSFAAIAGGSPVSSIEDNRN